MEEAGELAGRVGHQLSWLRCGWWREGEGHKQRDGRQRGAGTGRPAGNLVWKLKVSTRSPLPLSTGGRERGGGPILLARQEQERGWGGVLGCPGG